MSLNFKFRHSDFETFWKQNTICQDVQKEQKKQKKQTKQKTQKENPKFALL